MQPSLPLARPCKSILWIGLCLLPASSVDSAAGAFEEDPQVITASVEQVEQWIELLGSKQFATRERAAGNLVEAGREVLPVLNKAAAEHPDAEVRMRAAEICKQLTRDNLQARIDAFLAGDEVGFDGWPLTQAILSDTPRVRELFVDILRSYPELLSSLEGTPRERAVALAQVVSRVEKKIFVERKFPESYDAIALLLPAIDINVPLEGGYEEILLAVLQKPAASDLYRDPQLSRRFRHLVGAWIMRSHLRNRAEALFHGLSWDIPQTRNLAIASLTETKQVEPLVMALQAIARFGNETDVADVAALLDDHRQAAELGFSNGDRTRIEVGDVAMATIARLNDVPLTRIGFDKDSIDERFSFDVEDLGFPADDPQPRRAARDKIDALMADQQEQGPLPQR